MEQDTPASTPSRRSLATDGSIVPARGIPGPMPIPVAGVLPVLAAIPDAGAALRRRLRGINASAND